MKITQVRDNTYLIDVVIRAEAEQRVSLDSLSTLQISTPSGKKVPLLQIATIEYEQEYPLIWRRDRMPTITVQADTSATVLPATIVKKLSSKILELNAQLPAGYQRKTGGSIEESAKSQASVAAVVPLMLTIMINILMVQLQSIQRVILVLSVVPLGLIGIVAILLVANKPLGFVAILGIILTYVSAMKGKCGYCTDIPETRYVTILSTVILIQVLLFAFFPNQMRSFILSNKWIIIVLLIIF